MIKDRVEQQEHGYRSGHELLSATLKLPRADQDAVDRLSDMAGPLRPGETFVPYLTAYPLPSRSHYVIARTWQDLDTPRAGCVLTRSLLIPITMWETIESLDQVLTLLLPVGPQKNISRDAPVKAFWPPPPVQDPRCIELVEAMFLESRQPIVFFEAPEAEVIALRILAALWPSLRRNFAVCTFALAPRKIKGRDFDLLFSPKTARSRFANWPGRRIDLRASKAPRHRWSAATAFHIFQSDVPSLTAADSLGALMGDERGDEAALRLSLLWNELAVKADTTPTAVLGMLDILNSQSESGPKAFDRLAPVIARAAELASDTLPESEAWRFLVTLAAKFPDQRPPKSFLRKIKETAARIAKRSPKAALDFLELESKATRTVPAVVLAGLGNGICSNAEFCFSPDSLGRLAPEIGLRLFSLSSSFARNSIEMAKREPSKWISNLIRVFETPDRELKRKARRRLAPLLDDEALAPLLPPILDGVEAHELADIAVWIGRQTQFQMSAFDEPLWNAARDTTSLGILRNAIAFNFDNAGTDRFLLSTLRLDGIDIAWLCSGSLEKDRARRLLLRLMEDSSDRSLLAVQRDAASRKQILDMLLGDPKFCALQLARILALGELPIGSFLEIATCVLPLLEASESERFARRLLERALVEPEPEDKRVAALMVQIAPMTSPRRFVQMATNATAPAQRLGENVVLLEAAPPKLRADFVAQVDELSERLVRRGHESLGEAAYVAWAAMIADAGTVDRNLQVRAAMSTLAFALRSVHLPVSALIMASFPIVYDQLLESKGDEDFALVPALLALPVNFFLDWDRAKAARRDLVQAFLKSSWPPANLLLAAIDAGIDQKVLRRLSRKYGGDQYVEAIEQDAHRLDAPTRERVRQSLSNFRSNPSGNDWD